MKIINIVIFLCVFSMATASQNDQKLSSIAYEKLLLPQWVSKNKKPVVVAVIDDAFRLSHQQIHSFVYKNKNEISGNKIDDDNDGYIDNVQGWDLADADNDVMPPAGEEFKFYHGTMVAGIICQLAQKVLGPDAGKYLSILPLKVISDNATTFNYEMGYEALAYAIEQNVDIVCMAWSGGKMDKKYITLFDQAARKGISIFVAVGNHYSNKLSLPATLPTVFSVAAIDTSFVKMASSNYHLMVDAVAFGEQVRAPHAAANNAWFYGNGTSSAVALVAASAAVLKVAAPNSSPTELYDALKNTAQPVDGYNLSYAARLGAGFPNVTKALTYLLEPKSRALFHDPQRAQGKLIFEAAKTETTLSLSPQGGMKAFHFTPVGSTKSAKNTYLNFYVDETFVKSIDINHLPTKFSIDGNSTKMVLSGKRKRAFEMYYENEPIDSSTLYCGQTKHFTDTIGQFNDGSDGFDYSNNTSCKWQIAVPGGKRVKIRFSDFETQPNADFIYVFDGEATLQENLLAQFSGTDIPPVITTFSNKVLIWFVTDNSVTAKGWTLQYQAVDDAPGIEASLAN